MNKKYFKKIIAFVLAVNASFAFAQFTLFNSSNSGLTDNFCWFVNQNPSGDVWVGTQNNGAYKLSGTTWSNYTTFNSGIGGNYVTPVAFEGTTTTWFGSNGVGGGVSKNVNGVWTTYKTSNSGLPNNDVLAIVIDAQNNKWFGTRGGLAKFDGVNWTVYTSSNSGLPYNVIYSLEKDNAGNIWIGTPFNGLTKFNGSTWFTYTSFNSGLPDNDVYSLKYNIVTNSLWVGTFGGVTVLSNLNTWTTYNTGTVGFPLSNYIRGITHSYVTNKTYIATGGGGIGVFSNGSWGKFTTSNSNLPSNMIWSICNSASGDIWASTWGGGIVTTTKFFNTNVNELAIKEINISCYPNPVSTELTFKFNAEVNESGKISIYDSQGKWINTFNLNNTASNDSTYVVDIRTLAKGAYIFTFETKGSRKTGKFIVE